MRELRTYGKETRVHVEIYDKCKYEKDSIVTSLADYKGLKEWYIVTGDDATVIGDEMISSGCDADEYNEYLELHFTDGSQATFRNSHVDMFRIYE